MTNEDRAEICEEASEMLQECIALLRQAVRGTDMEGQANAYIIPHLESWAEYANRNYGIMDYAEYFYEKHLNGE